MKILGILLMLTCGLQAQSQRMYPGPIMMRLIAFVAFLWPVACAQEKLIDWHTNYREALSEAAAAKKPVFLEFRCEA
jgi:hypothetical protein